MNKALLLLSLLLVVLSQPILNHPEDIAFTNEPKLVSLILLRLVVSVKSTPIQTTSERTSYKFRRLWTHLQGNTTKTWTTVKS